MIKNSCKIGIEEKFLIMYLKKNTTNLTHIDEILIAFSLESMSY